jgi:hypothetical protein
MTVGIILVQEVVHDRIKGVDVIVAPCEASGACDILYQDCFKLRVPLHSG